MSIFTESEIESVADSISVFMKKHREKRIIKQQQASENNKIVTARKMKSQSKNWSKWKRRK